VKVCNIETPLSFHIELKFEY